jgi:uncharacterized protein involved in exopolysaccharide biosynthesis
MANEQLAVVKVNTAAGIATRDVIGTLWRRSHIWLSLMAVWAVLIAFYVTLAPRRYEGETVLLVKNSRSDMVLSPDERARYQGDQKESEIATELELLAQQDLLRRVVERTGAAQGSDVDAGVKRLRKNLEITPVFKADLIRVKYTAKSREEAKKVLSTLLSCYMDQHLLLHHSGDAYPFFDQQVQTSANELREAEQQLAEFEKRTGIVLITEQKQAAVQSIVDLEAVSRDTLAALNEARKQAQVLKQEEAGLPARITTQSRRTPNQYSIERLSTMMTELQNKRTELVTKYRPEDRLVKEVDQQIANTQAALSRSEALTSTEESTDVNPLRQAVEKELAAAQVNAETAQTKNDVLTRQIEQQRQAMAQLDSATTEHDSLERDVKRLEQNYKLYSGRREEARISDAMDKQRIANVVVAETPIVPSLPKPGLSGGLAGVFVLGCAFILSVTFAAGGKRQTFETPWELEAFTVMPVLATLAHDGDRSNDARSQMSVQAHELAHSEGD